MKKAVPVLLLTVAGLVPLWRYEAAPHTSSEVTADAGVVPQVDTQAVPAPTTPGGSGYETVTPPPTTTKPAATSKTVNGKLVKTIHGDVQVQVVFQGDKITSVKFLKQPNTAPTRMAVPTLVQETLQAGTANVDSVSGATQTSEAYVQSLQAAIDAKGN
jgi:uncharacterized protein with FMN-binding domain